MRRPLSRLPALLGVLLLAGCAEKKNGTLMVIEINSDIAAAQLDEIQVTVTASRGKGATHNFPLGADKRLPVRLALVPEGDPVLDVDIAVKGLSTKREVAKLAATARFVSDKALSVFMFLSRDCQLPAKADTCAEPQQCVAGGTCVAKAMAATIAPLGTPAPDAGSMPPPPPPDAAVERPPRDASSVTGTWMSVMPPALDGTLNGVHPVSDREVWVVAGAVLGFVYRFDGNAWTAVPLPPQTRPLKAVWAAGPDDVWIAGNGGSILHRVGGTFSPVPSGVTAPIEAIFGSGPNDVWFAGAQKTVLHWDGMRITPANEGVASDIVAGWASAANNVWIGGLGGGIYRRVGAAWVRQAEGMVTSTIFGLWTAGPDEVWAVGDGGALHLDGGRWTKVAVPLALGLSVWGAADYDVWVVGRGVLQRGLAAHYDGNTWTEVMLPMTGQLQAVRGVGAKDVWAVGKDVLRYR